MSEKIETGGPAFPRPQGGDAGMSLRQYAAIKLRVPNSGTDWLDEMIRTSLREELAAKAMQGFLMGGFESMPSGADESDDPTDITFTARTAYLIADAMLAARGEDK